MPNAFEIATFRAQNPTVVAWAENHPESGSYDLLDRDGLLTEEVANIVRGIIADEASALPEAPAEEWQAAWIPNGDYSVLLEGANDNDSFRFEYRIHLVSRGVLAGKRIVKVKRAGSTIFSGFGFVTRSGNFQLWSRFAGDTNERYVIAARALFASFQVFVESADASEIVSDWAAGHPVRSTIRSLGPEEITIHTTFRNLRCLHCNNLAREWTRPFPLCTDHSRIPARPAEVRTADPALERLIAEEERRGVPSLNNPSLRITEEFGRARTTRRRSPRSAPVVPVGPLMSEVSGKIVR